MMQLERLAVHTPLNTLVGMIVFLIQILSFLTFQLHASFWHFKNASYHLKFNSAKINKIYANFNFLIFHSALIIN